jgi:hypothetical protein
MRTRAIALVVSLCSIVSIGSAEIAQAHRWRPYKRDFVQANWERERYECRQHSHACTEWEMKQHLRRQARRGFHNRSMWLRANRKTRYYSHHGSVQGAINRAFPEGAEGKARAVAHCESEYDVYAVSSSGKYLGLYQMGPEERERFGFRWNKWTQARAAYRYWKISGWSPWPVCGD